MQQIRRAYYERRRCFQVINNIKNVKKWEQFLIKFVHVKVGTCALVAQAKTGSLYRIECG
ncbi:MAG: hypothetical protein BAJALOKI1v1_80034 [Promethearchaeota archaeon]|nr:MAG: hypothetical protein BAJALOKI1v1_80034 [Candidatus Lokiarchaeota archaeon]